MQHPRLDTALLTTVFALGVTVAAGDAAAQEAAAENLANADAAIPANQITISCSGGVATMGVNSDGNVIQFESPPGYEHIGVGAFSEGYTVHYTIDLPFAPIPRAAYDVDLGAGTGWNPPIGFGTFVVRYTTDMAVSLMQNFKADCVNRSLTVLNTITNTGILPVQLTGVCFARQADLDTDTGGSNGWADFINNHAASDDSSFAWNDKGDPRKPEGLDSHSMSTSKVAGHSPSVAKVTPGILDTDCPGGDVAAEGPDRGDFGNRIETTKNTLAPFESITLEVKYQRD